MTPKEQIDLIAGEMDWYWHDLWGGWYWIHATTEGGNWQQPQTSPPLVQKQCGIGYMSNYFL